MQAGSKYEILHEQTATGSSLIHYRPNQEYAKQASIFACRFVSSNVDIAKRDQHKDSAYPPPLRDARQSTRFTVAILKNN